ncbi:hypothetical protein [Deinococcus hopiensis]|nr:hypothetical protein [Deinococcus hopiensis]
MGITRLHLTRTGWDGVRRKTRVQLDLPVLPEREFAALPEHPDVRIA